MTTIRGYCFTRPVLVSIFALLSFISEGISQDQAAGAGLFHGLEFRNIAPARTGGRVVDIAVDPHDRSTRFAAVASGNVWKTENAGTTWKPVFDRYGSYSVGVVVIDPKDSRIVWVGTGENNSQRSVSKGDGVYKSVDGGNTWTNMGLKTSEHIGKIVIDPRNSDVVYVAAQGGLWAPGGERGLYKTTDGGKNWERVLFVSENTGISDIVFDPRDPDILLASSYQRRRHVGVLVAGGPDGGIWKSTDAGETWKKLKSGLPGGDLGRIGLAVSPQQPDVVYALIAGTDDTKGFYRSENFGDNWSKRSDFMVVDAQYYMELFPDPHQFDKVYCVNVFLQVTEDGGKTFDRVNNQQMHVDHHEVVFDPGDPDYLMIGNDGGIYETWDRGQTWRFNDNIPITQYYRVGVDDARPFYHIYGGTQDNATTGGPSRTIDPMGIRNSDWFVTVGGDGFQTRVDPDDPNIVYSESQYGGIVRYDRRSGERIDIQPQPGAGEPPLRWHWDAPLIISPHNGQRLYFAANKLFRSDDRGNSWTAVSDDLSRQRDRNRLEVMDRVWGVDAVFKNVWTSPLGTIVALDESPLREGLLCAGTDDGLIQVSEDGGDTWRRAADFPGVPEFSYVADVHCSRHDPDLIFAIFNNHKAGDFSPYIFRSDDRGRTWTSIRGDLPDGEYLWSIVQDHERPGLLFLGAEYGLYFSLDGGKKWLKFESGIPTIAIRDLEIQRRENDLVAASFGRGFFILDDYSPLRHVSEEVFAQETYLFPVKDALRYVQSGPGNDARGHGFFTSPNPPFGAVFTYYIKEETKTLKQQRQAAEAQLVESGKPVYYPDWEELAAERREDRPVAVFTIRKENGDLVRRITGPLKKGINRVVWDLEHPDSGPLAAPGTYSVTMARVVNGEWEESGAAQSFRVVPLENATLPAEDPEALEAFQLEVQDLRQAVREANRLLSETSGEVARLKQTLLEYPAPSPVVYEELNAVQTQLHHFEVALNGNQLMEEKMELIPPSINSRLSRIAYGLSGSTAAPTETQKDSYAVAESAFGEWAQKVNRFVDTTLTPLHEELEKAGIPNQLGQNKVRWE